MSDACPVPPTTTTSVWWRIGATASLLVDCICSGLLPMLGISSWKLIDGPEMNPVLVWLARNSSAGWVAYWALWIAGCWIMPDRYAKSWCVIMILMGALGLYTMLR